jgi:hypothetical protein
MNLQLDLTSEVKELSTATNYLNSDFKKIVLLLNVHSITIQNSLHSISQTTERLKMDGLSEALKRVF